jgi:hypothetical protein
MKLFIFATLLLTVNAFADVQITGSKAKELYESMAKATPNEYENETAPFVRTVGHEDTGVIVECSSNSVMKAVKAKCVISLTDSRN